MSSPCFYGAWEEDRGLEEEAEGGPAETVQSQREEVIELERKFGLALDIEISGTPALTE